MTYHNVLTDPGWFPLFTLANLISSTASVFTYVGTETRNGVNVIHLSVSQQFATSAGGDSTLFQHLTQADIFLDASTLLPVSYAFNIHPDNNALLDIPTEIRYSNYQAIGGMQVPLHVQKFVNNTLAVDLQFQTVVVNSGLSVNNFSAP